jgi:hypothetical protein
VDWTLLLPVATKMTEHLRKYLAWNVCRGYHEIIMPRPNFLSDSDNHPNPAEPSPSSPQCFLATSTTGTHKTSLVNLYYFLVTMLNIEATAYKATADTKAYVTIGKSSTGDPMIKKMRQESIFKDTDLKVGMIIVSINGASMEGKTVKDASGAIINASGSVTIVAKRCSFNRQASIADIVNELIEHPKLGIIRLDYNYPASPGDIDHPGSFGYPVVYRVVPGLTFQMAQSGELTEEVDKEFENAIRYLADEKKCCAITGDCGFMFWFGKRARAFTTVPVMLSALIQLPTITSVLCKETDRVLIVTANVKSLEPMKPFLNESSGLLDCQGQMKPLLNEVSGLLDHQEHYIYVGCEDVPHFGYEVENVSVAVVAVVT